VKIVSTWAERLMVLAQPYRLRENAAIYPIGTIVGGNDGLGKCAS
jgi:hypothetical protein